MCGRHSGFGYAFENIFATALIIYSSQKEKKISMPIKASHLRTLKVLKGKINWSELTLEQDTFYQMPDAEIVDAVIVQDGVLLLIQITTADPPNPEKINKLLSEMEFLSKNQLKFGKFNKIKGWFVSLFGFKSAFPTHNDLIITAGKDLVPFLGEQLYMKLKDVKNSFSIND